MERIQTVVIGAGVVGLAIARRLARSGREVVMLEAEGLIGSKTSARNSEVIHAGIYYPKNSLKARLCVAGKQVLYRYAQAHHIPHSRCGKLMVATSRSEEVELKALAAKAAANGVDDLTWLSGAEARVMEPQLACAAALLSPSTGIVDSHALMVALLGEAEAAGAMLALETPVIRLTHTPGGFEVATGGAAPTTLSAAEVINAAGHGAPGLGAMITPAPPAYLARGCYFALSGKSPFSRLIYPVPEPGGLGVHSTIDLAGRTKFGPDVEWIDAEDYTLDHTRGDAFYDRIRRYWPDLPDGALAPDYTGIRPKIVGPGVSAADFRIDGAERHGLPGYVGLYGIESPGLTSCLAIAEHVQATLDAAQGRIRRTA